MNKKILFCICISLLFITAGFGLLFADGITGDINSAKVATSYISTEEYEKFIEDKSKKIDSKKIDFTVSNSSTGNFFDNKLQQLREQEDVTVVGEGLESGNAGLADGLNSTIDSNAMANAYVDTSIYDSLAYPDCSYLSDTGSNYVEVAFEEFISK